MQAMNLAERVRPQNHIFDNYYPLLSNTEVFNGRIYQINLNRNTVVLTDNRGYNIADVRTWTKKMQLLMLKFILCFFPMVYLVSFTG